MFRRRGDVAADAVTECDCPGCIHHRCAGIDNPGDIHGAGNNGSCLGRRQHDMARAGNQGACVFDQRAFHPVAERQTDQAVAVQVGRERFRAG